VRPLAQSAVGRDVAGLGGDLEGGGAAEAPGGGDEPAGVRGFVGVGVDGGGGEAVCEQPDGFGGLGGVLGEVGGDIEVVDVAAVGELGRGEGVANRPDVEPSWRTSLRQAFLTSVA
jgi:hypothetical protein